MEKSEFSETQFVIGYLRELFPKIPDLFRLYMPSTREEKKWASDMIIRRLGLLGRYKYSEFYQFKRSKFYNKEVFDGLTSKIVIDTSKTPKFGFDIYNTKKTKQFNTLKKIAQTPRSRVYYCAPLFYTISDFNNFFNSQTIFANSKTFPLNQPFFQKTTIRLDSNHKILFDGSTQHICTDPLEIEGSLATERVKFFNEDLSTEGDLQSLSEDIFRIIKADIIEEQLGLDITEMDVNFFEVRELLIRVYNIYWFPIVALNEDK